MRSVSRVNGWGRRVLAAVVTVATALGLATVAAPGAAADPDPREVLGPRCSWSDYNFYVQNCWFHSDAMQQDIQVQIKRSRSDAAVYMLDGLRARDDWNAWTWLGHGVDQFVNDDVNVVMPVGGASQFYADWVGPFQGSTTPKIPRWETFLTAELPAALQRDFGISPQRNAVVGLSMGGTAAMNLAAHHRNQFKQATSLSGYLNTTWPGMYASLQFAMNDGSPGANVWDMWGGPFDPLRVRNDPLLQTPALSGLPMYLSSGAGILRPQDDFLANPQGGVAGIVLEWISRDSTARFNLAALATGSQPVMSYPLIGVHNWTAWTPELGKARPYILSALGLGPQPGPRPTGSL
ncbi:esterase family protein [Corynebacterium bovis]|uniref:alpha/beta hydrolase n=1 Tax=Corynebacterium bovis TaxID=36808 RepID=UPI00313905E9